MVLHDCAGCGCFNYVNIELECCRDKKEQYMRNLSKNDNRKRVFIIFTIITILGLFGAVFIFTGGIDSKNKILGNNLHATFYSRGMGQKAYETLEDAMKTVAKDYVKEDELYTAQIQNVAKVFMLHKNEVIGYEFLIREGHYYYIGERKNVFYFENQPEKYDWETTVLSDLSCSTRKSYKIIIHIGKKYMVLPAWGISDNEKIGDVMIDGQEIDEIITFEQEGKKYYLWIIHDLQTENDAADIKISLK